MDFHSLQSEGLIERKTSGFFGFVMAVTGSVVVTRETERDWQVCADGAKVEMGISEKHTELGLQQTVMYFQTCES